MTPEPELTERQKRITRAEYLALIGAIYPAIVHMELESRTEKMSLKDLRVRAELAAIMILRNADAVIAKENNNRAVTQENNQP